MSFFDEGDDEPPTRTARAPRSSSPPRPASAGLTAPADRRTLLIRRAVAGAVALVLLILVVLWISSCVHSQNVDSLKSYARNVSSISQDSDQRIGRPLFDALSSAQGKSALDVEVQINQLKLLAQNEASRAKALSVPGAMVGAQRALLMAVDLRAEALGKIATQVQAALGSQSSASGDAVSRIAGQMEVLLAADVLYSQRVVPLVEQGLADSSIRGEQVAGSRWVQDLGWLDPNTVTSRIGGQGAASTAPPATPGPHGHGLSGVSAGSNSLAAAPAVNRVSGGANPTLTVMVANQGASPETNVKVDITVAAGGKMLTASRTIGRTTPGNVSNVDVPVTGVPLNVPATVTVNVEAVSGEKNLANNKGTYTVIFGP